jgi:hypothetical protein
MKRILISLAFIFIVLGIISFILQGTPWLPLMVVLGATIGIAMGLSYPFPLVIKVSMILGLLASIVACYFGFKNRNKLFGQILAIAGLILWAFIGLMGLSTGT